MSERNPVKEEETLQIENVAASPVIYGDKLLFIKRTKPPYEGFWSMIGGKIEFGEDIEDAIVRETLEETGLNVKFVSIKGVVVEHLQTDGKITNHFVIWVCETTAETDHAKTQTEGEVRWFTKGEMRQNRDLFIPSDYKMTEEFFLRGRKRSLPVYKSKVTTDRQTYTLEYFGV
ncbi:hypothetical protein A3A54_02785 [Candidatus Curtissbacteria bacterium RIFCSPLOWO2_01_FULL_39_62]|uniref:Nudix hydrolase domain-containing protein n=2 Tax=Candidatus Curtissiibacteriota TaxID=1752717 RepID=A0A1F5GA93_9BACT|nr:MAG: hypothetical protein A2775_01585 [Candidatus Curtissbacteria bacterium RIFCSPHIGHO2_01_FULL_39_57]OGD88747.1 MAG: hypothetical protein A3D04_04285 [Candidatus Curtissbacteria bacterium RIFCSPHIGHO2_02_FULL_40_16b]OGD90291.1 MAG: hypothetical protein A3E11_01220 [Candidatus Curtissbacteria bacterium RIFCSPHIGHO2_12_FULL_38_37]OGD99185.1 MAG: hypothetical protein A3J17_00985 [Candidatus Curtissbacteria bacterium RIFCSPLOWO2_02_FULL_40_11]OGE00650.1 MAG: hypothetical protein A3A54_02785 [C